jgi:hypothetical protein
MKYAETLTETYIDPKTEKSRHIKERTLKAYRSLVWYSPYLFTYRESRWIPNTNNSTEGVFSQLKAKMRIHNGLRWDRKANIIHYLLSQK